MKEEEFDLELIVLRAREMPPRERSAFVRRLCGTNESLLSRVLDALGEDAFRPEYWDEPVTAGLDQYVPLEGQRLGPYRIVRRLGAGGMGEVYLAERADDEYHQQVAIKVVRPGMLSPQVQGRLRTERQILASLQHPNIARLLDGGRTADGTPYLVMEYVQGEPIDVYCDRQRLSIAQRLELMGAVCSAVHYAHQNLIVHRDLKPSNILVTPDGVPKLLDFGIAKLLGSNHSLHTLAVTHVDFRVMTPAHASPEQVRGEPITTASDIYVLGVLLYELLTGQKPYDFNNQRLAEIEELICERDPIPPSAMIRRAEHEAPEQLAHIATCRATTKKRVYKQLRGELDRIVLMAMRKEAHRRYSTVEQLAADLQRYGKGQPVIAAGDGWTYRGRKFLRRHAFAASLTSALVLASTTFAAVTYVQSQHIKRERDVAAMERLRAERVSEFLVELFQLSDPDQSRGNQVTARELLDIGARRVGMGLADQPVTRSALLSTIGTVYGSLGLFNESVQLHTQALEARIRLHGPEHPEVAAAKLALGKMLFEISDFSRAEAELTGALQMQRKLFGERALETARTLVALGELQFERSAMEEAKKLFNEAIAIYREHHYEHTVEIATAYRALVAVHVMQSNFVEASQLLRAAIDINRASLGHEHPQTAKDMLSLALLFHQQNKLQEAEPLYTECIELMERFLGPEHPKTLDALTNYGRFLQRKGDLERAEPLLRQVIATERKVRGDRHYFVAYDMVNLAAVLLDLQRLDEAELTAREALEIYNESLPAEHTYIAAAHNILGRISFEKRDFTQAERLLRRSIAINLKSLPPTSVQIATARSALGYTLVAQQKYAEGEALLRQNVPIIVAKLGEQALVTRRARAALEQLPTLQSSAHE